MKQDYLHRDSETTVKSVSMKFDTETQCVCDCGIVAVKNGTITTGIPETESNDELRCRIMTLESITYLSDV
jgi:hypothetical protein